MNSNPYEHKSVSFDILVITYFGHPLILLHSISTMQQKHKQANINIATETVTLKTVGFFPHVYVTEIQN